MTAVSTTFGRSEKFVGWCETCKRRLGPFVDDEASAQAQIDAHQREVADATHMPWP